MKSKILTYSTPITLQQLAQLTFAFPVVGFIFCISCSYLFNFEVRLVLICYIIFKSRSLNKKQFKYIVTSISFKFQESTFTHCDVVNIAPSISASIGSFSPQKYVWKLLIGLHSGPRFIFLALTRSFFVENLAIEKSRIAEKFQISTLIRVIIFSNIQNIYNQVN